MQNKKNINPHTLGRLLSTELRFSFNWGRFLFILALTIFPVLFYMVIPALVTFTGGKWKLSKMHLYWLPFFLHSMIVYIFIKVMTSVSSKTKIDKSRAQFLYYNKYDIILVKLFIATLDFLLGFLYLLFFGNVIAAAKGEHFDFASYNLKAFLMLAILWILYIFAFAMSQWIISLVPSQAAAYGLTFAFLLLLILQINFLNGIIYTGVLRYGDSRFPKTWLIKHQSIIAWIPLLNIGLMGGIGQTGVVVKVLVLVHEVKRTTTYPSMLEHEWYGFVPIIYFLLIGLGTFKWQVAAQKRFLSLG